MVLTVPDVISTLQASGVILRVDGDRIRACGPLDDSARAMIRKHKAAILEALRKPPAPVPVDQRGLPAAPCADCGERHFWRSADGWQCSDCCRMPARFLGESCTIPPRAG